MKPLEMTTPTDTTIQVVRGFEAPPALVWRAFSEPALVQRWMTGPEGWTMPECEIDFRVGGSWRYVWHNGSKQMVAHGVFRNLMPQARIVHTETFDMCPDMASEVETRFAASGAGTLMTVTLSYPDRATRDGALQSGMEHGMEASYGHLDALRLEETV